MKIDATTRELERRGIKLEIESGLAVRMANEGDTIMFSIERAAPCPADASDEPSQEPAAGSVLPARRRRGRPPINPVRFTNEPPRE